MKTIPITFYLTVPDGVEVNIEQGQPFKAQPDPEKPTGACPEHGTPWRLVPEGISKKTGRRYNAFWTCSTQGCDIKPGQVIDQLPF